MIKWLVDLFSGFIQLLLLALLAVGAYLGYVMLPHEVGLPTGVVELSDLARTLLGAAGALTVSVVIIAPALILLDVRNTLASVDTLLKSKALLGAGGSSVAIEPPKDQRRRVPESIEFGADVLLIPAFKEMGAPARLARYGVFTPERHVGDWVDRGEPLVSVEYSMFPETKARWPSKDEAKGITYTLNSPIAGLIIGFRRENVGYHSSMPSATASGRALVYGEQDVWPIILVPRDEPPQSTGSVAQFSYNIIGLLNQAWPRLLYSHAEKGYVRLSEALEASESIGLGPEATSALKARDARGYEPSPCATRAFSPSDVALVHSVQQLRSADLLLRDKLVHLVAAPIVAERNSEVAVQS